MKIAIISPPWITTPPLKFGGIELVSYTMAKGYQELGHEILLITVPGSQTSLPKIELLNAPQFSKLNWGAIELDYSKQAYRAAQDYDIIHDNTMLGPLFNSPPQPVIATQHQTSNYENETLYQEVSKAAHLVAISHRQAALGKDSNIEYADVIHHGLMLNSYFQADRNEHLLFLGRLNPVKGPHLAVQAALASGHDLVIAAPAPRSEGAKEYFDSQIKPYLSTQIKYIGEVNDSQKKELLATSKALINPIQREEPFGLVMIEALAAGLPVIATNIGAAPELVRHEIDGFIVKNFSELVHNIHLVNDLDRDAIRDHALANFSYSQMAKKYINLFERLL